MHLPVGHSHWNVCEQIFNQMHNLWCSCQLLFILLSSSPNLSLSHHIFLIFEINNSPLPLLSLSEINVKTIDCTFSCSIEELMYWLWSSGCNKVTFSLQYKRRNSCVSIFPGIYQLVWLCFYIPRDIPASMALLLYSQGYTS